MKLFKSTESAPATTPVVDMEQALLDLEIASIDLNDLFEEGVKIAQSYEMYTLIVDTIEKSGGVTRSLEAMFGENFTCADTMKDEASQEAFEWAEKAWNWIITFCKKIWAWISSLLTSTDSVRAQLRELKGKAAQVAYPVKIKRSKMVRELEKQLKLFANIQSIVSKSGNIEGLDANAAALAEVADIAEEVEIKSATDLLAEISLYEKGFESLYRLRENFEKLQKDLSADKFKPAQPKKGEQPKEGEAAAPADPNKGKFAELQGKVMEAGKLVQKGNRALVVASKMLIAVCKVK